MGEAVSRRSGLSLRSAWRKLYGVIDRRVSVEGDNETRRFQKVLVVVVSVGGAIATAFNAQTLFSIGLDAAGWSYVGSIVYLLAGAAAVLLWPRAYGVITFVLLLDVLIFPGAAQLASGGLTSGLYAFPWAIFAPLGAALALGGRSAFAHLGLFAISLILLALLDPLVQGSAPEVSSSDLLSFNVPSLLSLGAIAGATSLYLIRQVDRFRNRADSLLLNMMPDSVASRLKARTSTIADRYEDVTVLFADIVGFTPLSSGEDPTDVVAMLNRVFSEFDDLAHRYQIEKVKTIGDSYMAAAGLFHHRADHNVTMIEFALDMLAAVEQMTGLDGSPLRLRIGVHTGPVVAGVIGRERFSYDLWGDTVNMASRMESTGVIDMIQMTEDVAARVEDRYELVARDPIDIKGKGPTLTYLLGADQSREMI